MRSQILDLLLEFNASIHIPPTRRFKLDLPSDVERGIKQPDQGPILNVDAATASERLTEAKERLLAGTMTADECKQLEESMLRGDHLAPRHDFATLLNALHHPDHPPSPSDYDDLESTLGFLTPDHEMEYIAGMDSRNGIIYRACERRTSVEREREVQIRNPLSVYNWLKNRAHLLNQQQDAAEQAAAESSSKPSRTTATRNAKRAREPVREEDMYDEDGIALEVPAPSTGRGKRKRDEDGGYRPKGGSGGRPKKKESSAKRAKRGSVADSAA